MHKFLILFLLCLIVPLCAQEKEKGKLAIFEDEAGGKTKQSSDGENAVDILIAGVDEGEQCGQGLLHDLADIVRIIIYSEEFDLQFAENLYTPYPYYFRDTGIYGRDTGKKFSIILSSSYFHHTDYLNGILLSADLSPHPLFSINLDYNDLTETMNTRYDHLRLFDLFVSYNRLRSERFVFSWGVGVKGLRGDKDLTAAALSTRFEVFPVYPVSFSLNYSIGYFPSATVDDLALNVSFHFDRYRFQAGFKNFRAGRLNIGGLVIGLGLYL